MVLTRADYECGRLSPLDVEAYLCKFPESLKLRNLEPIPKKRPVVSQTSAHLTPAVDSRKWYASHAQERIARENTPENYSRSRSRARH